MQIMNPHAARPYDVVVFGATSFVGRIVARYLHETFGGAEDENGERGAGGGSRAV